MRRRRGGPTADGCASSWARSPERPQFFPELCQARAIAAEIGHALRGGDRPDLRRARLGRVPRRVIAVEVRRAVEEVAWTTLTRAIVTGTRATPSMSSFPGCCTPAFSARRTRMRESSGVDASAVPADVVVLVPDDVRDLGRYGCQIARSDRACGRPCALRRRPRGGGRRGDAARGRGGARAHRGRLRGAAGRLRRLEEALPAAALVHERIQVSTTTPPTSACALSRARTSAISSASAAAMSIAASRRRRSSSRGRSGRRLPSTRDGAARCARPVGRGPARGVDGHADAVQRALGPGGRLRGRGGTGPRVVCPPMGGSFGAKTFVHSRGDRRPRSPARRAAR